MEQPKFKVSDRVHRSKKWIGSYADLVALIAELGTVEKVYAIGGAWYLNVRWDRAEWNIPAITNHWPEWQLELAPSQKLAMEASND